MTTDNNNIAMIGYRGTGKTTFGRLLAERIAFAWIDTDREIEKQAGCSIADLFRQQGEAAFRDLEARVIRECTEGESRVLSLGGGAVLRPETRQRLRDTCTHVVWLRSTAQTIWQRVSADPNSASQRPNLTQSGGIAEVQQLLSQRIPVYDQCATVRVDTDVLDVERILAQILDCINLG